jgi:hypothetical protein
MDENVNTDRPQMTEDEVLLLTDLYNNVRRDVVQYIAARRLIDTGPQNSIMALFDAGRAIAGGLGNVIFGGDPASIPLAREKVLGMQHFGMGFMLVGMVAEMVDNETFAQTFPHARQDVIRRIIAGAVESPDGIIERMLEAIRSELGYDMFGGKTPEEIAQSEADAAAMRARRAAEAAKPASGTRH